MELWFDAFLNSNAEDAMFLFINIQLMAAKTRKYTSHDVEEGIPVSFTNNN